MRHTQVKTGETYLHHWDGKVWLVRVLRTFEDRQRWGWEGMLLDAGNSPCWGWCDELTVEIAENATKEGQ